MSEKSAISDKVLGELALKIESELPEELTRFITFRQDEKTQNLIVDWSVQLPPEDLKLLTDVVAAYGGSYTNLKVGSEDRGCFMVPKNQPPPAIPAEAEQEKKTATPEPAAAQPMKQPSPLTIHQDKYCSSCSDQATCNPRTSAGRERLRLCFSIMELQYFDFFAEGLLKLNQNLEASNKVFSQILVEQQQRHAQSQTTQQSQPQSTPVQRNTRPTEGHMEGGITWIWDKNRTRGAIRESA